MDLSSQRLLALTGATALALQAYKLSSFLYAYIRPSSLPRYLKTSDGSPPWAFITGASDGIGKAFAFDLASRGFNVVLHGRNRKKLEDVEAELQDQYPSRAFRIVVADASDLSSIDFQALAQSVADVSLKVLINNAGSTMPRGHEFDTVEEFTRPELEASVACNATFHLLVINALMPNLIAHQPALIINIGSFASLGMPMFPAYAPSKAFQRNMTDELAAEQHFLQRDIEVICMLVGSVTNTNSVHLPTSFANPDAPTWVRSALGRIGCGRTQITPFLPHALQAFSMSCMPEVLARRFKAFVLIEMAKLDPHNTSSMEGIRALKNKKDE